MQIFHCPNCQSAVWFHNLACSCGMELFFDVDAQSFFADRKPCENRSKIACNWQSDGGEFCRACAMTETTPDLQREGNDVLWSQTEAAKRWVISSLRRWGWFAADDAGPAPRFRMLSEQTRAGDEQITMGHDAGEIVLNVTEANPAVMAARQQDMGELYRSMVGHVRHELGHYIFWRMEGMDVFTDATRPVFGDERADYADALAAYHANPPPEDDRFVSRYAQAHPHEDWAESFAHLLHLVDLEDSAGAAGLSPTTDAYTAPALQVIEGAVTRSIAFNHMTRSMGLRDLYPFVLSDAVRSKIVLIHGFASGGPPR